MARKLVTAASTYPVTVAEAKAHLREVDSDNDDLIETLVKAATGHAEKYLGRALINQTWDLYLDDFPDDDEPIEIPLPPLIEVVGVFTRDADGNEDEVDLDSVIIDLASEPARVSIGSGSWPTVDDDVINAVRVRFRAGYVDNSVSPAEGDVPDDIKAAILLHVGALFAHREEVVIGQAANLLPWGAKALLDLHRHDLSMA